MRVSRAWNAFLNRTDPFAPSPFEEGYSSSVSPSRKRLSMGNERSLNAAIISRMALDVSTIKINHVRIDENSRFTEVINSGLNDCLNMSANIDQTGAAFIQDAATTLFDQGVIAIVPVDTTRDPTDSEAYDIHSLRVGTIRQWYPSAVRVDLYNDRTGKHEELTLPKTTVAIVENPMYNIMNEPNSTLNRLIRKLNLLDVVDEQSSSGKLDLIIQLPYLIKSDARREQAEKRRKDITDQLRGSEYGVAYTDGTEKIIQLNRPVENNLMSQIEYLTSMLYSQLGLTMSIMDGTADEKTMLNYYKRTIEPVTTALVNSMARTFLSKTARTQGQRLMAFNDAFKLVPMSDLAELSDKFTRNEILSSNEVRSIIGFRPAADPSADELRNKNLNVPNE
jgi:hypothetical protein